MKQVLWLARCLLLIGLIGGGETVAAERVALVIGNSAYAHAPPLDNPQRDAVEVAKALTDLGFTIIGGVRLNLSTSQMDAALREFGDQARSATAAVVYFSGHGIEASGQNYLIPVDAKLEYETEAPRQAVLLEVVLGQVGSAKGYGLVILDACRDNPFARQMRLADGRTKGFGGDKGLKPVEPSGQVYVAYAAKGGTKAQEGRGQNSVFTMALLPYLRNYRQEPLPLVSLFGAVREDVLQTTTKTQEPWLYGAFGKKPVYLTGALLQKQGEENEEPLRPEPNVATLIERLKNSMNKDADEHWLGYDFTSKTFRTEKMKEMRVGEGIKRHEYTYDLCSITRLNYIALEEGREWRVRFDGGWMKIDGKLHYENSFYLRFLISSDEIKAIFGDVYDKDSTVGSIRGLPDSWKSLANKNHSLPRFWKALLDLQKAECL